MAACTPFLKIILERFICLQNEPDPDRQEKLRTQIKENYFYLLNYVGQGKDQVAADDIMGDIADALQDEDFLKIVAKLPVIMPDMGLLYEFPQDPKYEIRYSLNDYTFTEFTDRDAFNAAKLPVQCVNTIYYVKFTQNGKSFVSYKMRSPAYAIHQFPNELEQDLTGKELRQFIFHKIEERSYNFARGAADFNHVHDFYISQLKVIYGLARDRFFEFLSTLAEKGQNIAEINGRLKELVGEDINKTALHYAAEFNDADLIRALIAKGADVTVVDNNGNKAIDLANANEVLKPLIEAGAQKAGISPILYAIQVGGKAFRTTLEYFSSYADTQQKVKEAVGYLIQGEAINKIDSEGKTALHYAVESGNVPWAEALIKEHAAVNPKDAAGETPLHYAARNNDLGLVPLLIENGADVSILNNNHDLAIHLADDKKILELLVKAGAKEAKIDDFQYAIQVGGKAFPNALGDFSNSKTVNDIDYVVRCLTAENAIDKMDSDGNTALDYAVEAGNVDLTNLLIREGADEKGRTPLHYAAREGDAEVVRELIQAGANVNQVDVNRQTPLYYAARWDNVRVVGELIQAGADVNCADVNGVTPLHYALSKNNVEMALLLLKAGADIYKQHRNCNSKFTDSVHLHSSKSEKDTETAALIQRYHTLSVIGKVALGVGCVVGIGLVVFAAAALVATVVGVTHGAAVPVAVAAYTFAPSSAISVGAGVDTLGAASTLVASYALFKHIKKTRDELSHRFATWAMGYEFFRPSRKSAEKAAPAVLSVNQIN